MAGMVVAERRWARVAGPCGEQAPLHVIRWYGAGGPVRFALTTAPNCIKRSDQDLELLVNLCHAEVTLASLWMPETPVIPSQLSVRPSRHPLNHSWRTSACSIGQLSLGLPATPAR